MSLDFSQKIDLVPLATVVRALQGVAQPLGIEYFLMGAAARDLMLRHAHNIEPTRLTEDVDFAVSVPDWPGFESLRTALLGSDQFSGKPGPAIHKLRHKATGLPLDVVPFGGIENTDRTISWPPDHHTVFDCFGAREAFEASIPVQLQNNVTLRVASIREIWRATDIPSGNAAGSERCTPQKSGLIFGFCSIAISTIR